MTDPPVGRPGAAAPRPAAAGKSWLAAQGRLPLAFMGLGLLWLAVSVGVPAVRPDLLLLPHVAPPVIALTHAWMLGFFTSIACGAVYQLVPVALSTTLWNERLGWMHFALHAVGVPGMVWLFWTYRLGPLAFFGIAVALGVALFVLNTLITVLRSTRRDVIAVSIIMAAGWLLLAVLAGLFLVANRLWGMVTIDPVALLRAHAHLGLVGFFITLLQGVGFQLVPMFTMGEVRHWGMTKAGLWFSQCGLALLIPSLIWSLEAATFIGACAIATGLIVSGLGLWRTLATRRKRRLDPGLVGFLCGWVGLCVAALAGAVLTFPGTARGVAPGGFNPMIYALLGIPGALLPCVAGMMCKIVPFLTWMRAYGPHVGRRYTPPAHSLVRPSFERWGLALQQASTLPLIWGAWHLDIAWLAVGAWVLAAGAILLLADMLGVFRHLWLPAVKAPIQPTTASS